jgi:hypothetical protein
MPKVGQPSKPYHVSFRNLQIRFMQPNEEDTIKGWRKLDPEVDEFVYLWSRWKRWDTEPPIVAVVQGKLAGYHGLSFTKSGYINSMSQFVRKEYRGNRLAVLMIDYLLRQGAIRKMSRLCFRCPLDPNGAGYLVWTSLCLVPFGQCAKDYWFDVSLDRVTNVQKLRELGSSLHLPPTSNKRRLAHYRKSNLLSVIKEYQCLLS